jgi:hypothetical protein
VKKIDFHIHTVATAVDADFEFDLSTLKEYVEKMAIDGIAITNHNTFDRTQFDLIDNALDITVLPGMELNLGKGHCLFIADVNDLDGFSEKCAEIAEVLSAEDNISVEKLREICGQLSKYLIVPHYMKNPKIDEESLTLLGADCVAGEVTSPKKFMYAKKDDSLLTPLLFSDSRAKKDWSFTTRQTYIDVGTLDIRSLKASISDKSKVFLSEKDGKELIQVTPNKLTISSGLTVILGGRSSGKSYTLNEISKFNENVKYLKQFDLIETDSEEKEEENFNKKIGLKRQEDSEKYLHRFRNVVDEVKNISLDSDNSGLESYINSLKKNASEIQLNDEYSKAKMFTESEYEIEQSGKLGKLIDATDTLLNPGKYKDLVDASVDSDKLLELLTNLIEKFREEALDRRKHVWTNEVVASIKHALGTLSALTPIEEINLIEIARNKAKVARFETIVKELQKPRILDRRSMQRFTIVESSVKINGAQDLKNLSGKMLSFSDAFEKYEKPYEFLKELIDIEQLDPTSYYKFFTKIDYKIINEHGTEISGGERAEFRLIQEIDTASSFDMLLIDEPESSFDNLFLSKDVNGTVKGISKNTPVVLVTHNNTLGASIRPDYLIYAERKIVNKKPEFKVYTGRATDKQLTCIDDRTTVNTYDVALEYLEAGEEEYKERGEMYEMLKD